MDYIILEYDDTTKLRTAVKEWMDDGWEPAGGLTITAMPCVYKPQGNIEYVPINVQYIYAQAMLKR